ncbi:MAG TPA: transcription termination/antitermination protein NusA [Lachnospiraceae bacterium]|nr:transcription termination/antitermination protein NusA [Lachnospiraceae bacterium]
MNTELKEAMELLEKEKGISKASLIESIELSLMQACKTNFGKTDNISISVDPETCEFSVTAEKEVVENEEDIVDSTLQVTVAEARKTDPSAEAGDIITIDINSKNFGRIATQNAKNVILQRIREEERNVVFNQYNSKIRQVVSGVVSRQQGRAFTINLGKADALLSENEQVKSEKFVPTDRIKVYVLDVKNNTKGPKILVSRTHPELVKKLFEEEVTEIREGVVEIKGISREPGSRTKMAVYSNNPDVDAVGACVGMNGSRVTAVVNELRGEKIDIIAWNENPAILIENALSPAKVVSVEANPDEHAAKVIVPDYQLSLAIGKEGQNARLAARLTGYKIDIKSETQAKAAGSFNRMYQDDLNENVDLLDESGEMNGRDLIDDIEEETTADLSGLQGGEE